MSWTSRLLRVAAVLALIQGLAHGALHVRYQPSHGAAEEALVAGMKSGSFDFGGFPRTYWGFFFGYGLMVVVTCLVQACAMWLVAGLARGEARRFAPLISLYAAAYCLHGMLAWHYFFAKPVIFDALIALALVGAASVAWRSQVPPPTR